MNDVWIHAAERGRSLLQRAAHRLTPVRAILLIVSCLAAAEPALAQVSPYQWQYKASNTNGVTWVTSRAYGSWQSQKTPSGAKILISTGPGTVQPPGKTTHFLQFDFMAVNYFGSGGHFGAFARGDIYTPSPVYQSVPYPFRGHGVILGNVSGYPTHQHPGVGSEWQCNAPPLPSTIAIEAAGDHTFGHWLPNCVFGSNSYGPALENFRQYRVSIAVTYHDPGPGSVGRYTTSWHLWDLDNWMFLGGRQLSYNYEKQLLNGRPIGGWFIGEAFNDGNWELYLNNVSEGWQ
ncbi:MAG TPA: hypothetical protein VFZ09_09370 [Archangium sp.]|uniref:hypothetical protein n=1 Tax=Archangium sp. TaxID=1872627 RepID=UPI002E337517|nr:hypothetical protein [Archangium sp.]HEX5746444.1 hypothetical protein [Archangium sp.]